MPLIVDVFMWLSWKALSFCRHWLYWIFTLEVFLKWDFKKTKASADGTTHYATFTGCGWWVSDSPRREFIISSWHNKNRVRSRCTEGLAKCPLSGVCWLSNSAKSHTCIKSDGPPLGKMGMICQSCDASEVPSGQDFNPGLLWGKWLTEN